MSRTDDMFSGHKPPRQPHRKLMHVCDAGDTGCGTDDERDVIVKFACVRCGYESDWMRCSTVTEAKRGMPCPRCNSTPIPE